MDARILRTFDKLVSLPGREPYVARIAARLHVDGIWEAWVEYTPEGGGPTLRSQRETTQSDLPSIERWAEHLSLVYLQGSLERTLAREHGQVRVESVDGAGGPRFEGPAPELRGGLRPAPDDVALNPVAHAQRGEDGLRERLAQLPISELRAIALAYHFDDRWAIDVEALERSALTELIMAGARRRTV
jgi:hypothetical protein